MTILSRGITPLSLIGDTNIYPLSKSRCLSQYMDLILILKKKMKSIERASSNDGFTPNITGVYLILRFI